MKFSGFLITFERTAYLSDTISYIFSQFTAPQKILILDNSFSNSIIENLPKSRLIEYLRIGNNLGPAGAAKIGLEILSNEGFDWIYWGDDDDPPIDSSTFERLLKIAMDNPDAGVIGKVGGYFFPYFGRTRVFINSELTPIIEADYVSGGKQMIVSSKLVKAGILPDPKLFFGFEELEFCLRVKDAGFKVLVDGEGIKNGRNNSGNYSSDYKWKGKSIGDLSRINRQYYSVRNMLYILWSRREYFGYSFFLVKSLLKIPFSLKYGFSYFRKLSRLYFRAIFHHWIGRYGQYIPTR